MRRFSLLLLLLMICCKPSMDTLPILSYTINNQGEKDYYQISYSGFTNQNGEHFSTENLKGKICIANFFFTRCPSICPPMRTSLISIAEEFSEEDDFLIISHTIDPNHDSVSVLKSYSETTGIDAKKWQFIRASELKTKEQAKQFMTNFEPNSDGSDFYHSSYVALLDQKQHIRGFYNILEDTEVSRLKHDLRTISKH